MSAWSPAPGAIDPGAIDPGAPVVEVRAHHDLRRRRTSRGIPIYLALEILKTAGVVMLVFEAVIGCLFSFGAVRDYGIGLSLLIPLLAPALAAYLDAIVPISLLFATAMVYGRFIADREVAALKSFGFSYSELLLAPALLGGLLALVMLLLNFYYIPVFRFSRDNLGTIIFEKLKDLGEGENQSFELGKNQTLWIESFDGTRLRGIFIAGEFGKSFGLDGLDGAGETQARGKVDAVAYPIFAYASRGEVVVERTERGKEVFFRLQDISVFLDAEYTQKNLPADSRDLMNNYWISDKKIPARIDGSVRNNKELSWPELRVEIGRARGEWERARAGSAPIADQKRLARTYHVAVYEVQRRIAMALSTLLFPALAAAIALFFNSPNRLFPVFVALMAAPAIYYVLEMKGGDSARNGHLPIILSNLGNWGLLAVLAGLLLGMRRRTVW